MRRLAGLFLVVLMAFAVPAGASQFINIPFDELVGGSAVIVRGTLGPVSSSWDADGKVIYSRSQLIVTRYLAGDGPEVLTVREVGGTVGNYTQQAIGFPVLRQGEDVVLFLTPWEDGHGDVRINEYAKGKYLVERDFAGVEYVMRDHVRQGDEAPEKARPGVIGHRSVSVPEGIPIDQFRDMIHAVMVGRQIPARRISE